MSGSMGFKRSTVLFKVALAFALVLTCLSFTRPAAEANAAGAAASSARSAPTAKKASEKAPPKFKAGEVIVRYAPKASAKVKRSADRKAGGESVSALGSSVPGLAKVKLKKGVSVEEAVAAYNRQPGVLYAEPNYRGTIDAMPDDPKFGSLWGLDNTGQDGGTEDADIDAPEAWEKTTGSGDVVVAVIDTGIDYTHPDLVNNMWTNPGEIPDNEIDDDGNGYVDDVYGIDTANGDSDPFDDHSHGTHCAGTIGAEGNNGIGVAGVNWDVKLMAVKWIGADGWGETEGAIEAIEYAHSMGADLSSNSWHIFEYSQAMYDTIAAIDGLLVFAAGNEESNTDVWMNIPSAYDLPNILAVGASDRNDDASWFSNYGLKTVDVFAPGEDVLSTVPGESYDSYSGTSMATPHTAGVAALLLSESPGASWQSLKLALMGSAELKPAFDRRCLSSGRLNADFALDAFEQEAGSLTGVVRDVEGAPIEGASVSIGSTLYGTTGADGSYTIEDIVPGAHSVVCSHPDFLTEIVSGVAIAPASTATLDIELRLAGKISGTVTMKDGATGIQGIQVTAFREYEGSWEPAASAVTGPNGAYLIGGLDTDTYRVEFADAAMNYVTQYYNGKEMLEEADPVEVTEGVTTAMIDAALEEYGKISGTVHAPDGSSAAGIWVTAYRQYEKWWEPVSGAETLDDGTYVLSGLTTGTYRVEFFDPSGEYAWEYYDDKVTVDRATNVAVTTGSVTPNIDATLGVAGKISGTVTSAIDGTPIEGAWVNVYRNNAGSWDWTWAGAETGPDGTYTIGGLPSGTYRLEYWDWSGAYASEFYDGKDTLRSATPVTVRAGSTRAGIDVTLDPVGGISGTVTSAADGTSVQGAWVSAYRKVGKSWEWYGDAETGDDGTYNISGLLAGTYHLEIYDPSGEYAYEFYDGKDTLERANSVTVATGLVTAGIDVTLDPAGRISGTVTAAADGELVGTVVAIAYRQNGRSFEPIGYGETMPDGTYTIGGLRAGTYRVEFLDFEGNYAYEFYDDAATLASAKDIVIGTGSETAGIDAMLDPAGKISGTVTLAADDSPLEYAWVTVYRQVGKGGWEPMFGAETASDGTYTVGGLRTGTYRAEFMYWGEAFGSEFYDNATTLRKATDISVTAEETTFDINAALELGAWPDMFTSLGTSRGAPRSGPKYSTIDVRERLMR